MCELDTSEIFQTPPEENSRWLENTQQFWCEKRKKEMGIAGRLEEQTTGPPKPGRWAWKPWGSGPLSGGAFASLLFPFPLIATGAFHLLKHAREKNFCVHERLCVFNNVEGGTTPRKMSHGSYVVSRQEPKLHFHRGSSSDASKAPFLFLTHFFLFFSFFHLFFISLYVSSFIPFLYSPFFSLFILCLFLTLF